MSRTKKITFNMIAAKAPVQECVSIPCEWLEAGELSVQRVLQADKAFSFVSGIAGACIDETSGQYLPECFDYAMRVNVLMHYAGFEEPTDIKKAYRVLYETDLFDRVFDVIDHSQFDILIEAAHRKAEYMADASLSTAAAKLDDVLAKVNEVMNSSVQTMKDLSSPEFDQKFRNVAALFNAGNSGMAASEDVEYKETADSPLIQVLKDE